MEQQASVIVVGAGAIGCSVAFQLARLGQRDVVVLSLGRFARGELIHETMVL